VNKNIRLDIIKGQDELNMLRGNLWILLSDKKEKKEDPRRDDLGQFKKNVYDTAPSRVPKWNYEKKKNSAPTENRVPAIRCVANLEKGTMRILESFELKNRGERGITGTIDLYHLADGLVKTVHPSVYNKRISEKKDRKKGFWEYQD